MAYTHSLASARGLGVTSLALGFFGLVLYWLGPLAVILSSAGVILGCLACIQVRRSGQPGYRSALYGTLLSVVALALDLIVMLGGFRNMFYM